MDTPPPNIAPALSAWSAWATENSKSTGRKAEGLSPAVDRASVSTTTVRTIVPAVSLKRDVPAGAIASNVKNSGKKADIAVVSTNPAQAGSPKRGKPTDVVPTDVKVRSGPQAGIHSKLFTDAMQRAISSTESLPAKSKEGAIVSPVDSGKAHVTESRAPVAAKSARKPVEVVPKPTAPSTSQPSNSKGAEPESLELQAHHCITRMLSDLEKPCDTSKFPWGSLPSKTSSEKVQQTVMNLIQFVTATYEPLDVPRGMAIADSVHQLVKVLGDRLKIARSFMNSQLTSVRPKDALFAYHVCAVLHMKAAALALLYSVCPCSVGLEDDETEDVSHDVMNSLCATVTHSIKTARAAITEAERDLKEQLSSSLKEEEKRERVVTRVVRLLKNLNVCVAHCEDAEHLLGVALWANSPHQQCSERQSMISRGLHVLANVLSCHIDCVSRHSSVFNTLKALPLTEPPNIAPIPPLQLPLSVAELYMMALVVQPLNYQAFADLAAFRLAKAKDAANAALFCVIATAIHHTKATSSMFSTQQAPASKLLQLAFHSNEISWSRHCLLTYLTQESQPPIKAPVPSVLQPTNAPQVAILKRIEAKPVALTPVIAAEPAPETSLLPQLLRTAIAAYSVKRDADSFLCSTLPHHTRTHAVFRLLTRLMAQIWLVLPASPIYSNHILASAKEIAQRFRFAFARYVISDAVKPSSACIHPGFVNLLCVSIVCFYFAFLKEEAAPSSARTAAKQLWQTLLHDITADLQRAAPVAWPESVRICSAAVYKWMPEKATKAHITAFEMLCSQNKNVSTSTRIIQHLLCDIVPALPAPKCIDLSTFLCESRSSDTSSTSPSTPQICAICGCFSRDKEVCVYCGYSALDAQISSTSAAAETGIPAMFAWPEESDAPSTEHTQRQLVFERPLVVIDAPNVAMKAGNNESWRVDGITACAKYFQQRGFRVVAFVPDSMLSDHTVKLHARLTKQGKKIVGSRVPDDVAALQALVKKRIVFLTPAKDYDDDYAIQYAITRPGCCIVTNDLYRDFLGALPPQLQLLGSEWAASHLISFSFVGSATPHAITPGIAAASTTTFIPNRKFSFPSQKDVAALEPLRIHCESAGGIVDVTTTKPAEESSAASHRSSSSESSMIKDVTLANASNTVLLKPSTFTRRVIPVRLDQTITTHVAEETLDEDEFDPSTLINTLLGDTTNFSPRGGDGDVQREEDSDDDWGVGDAFAEAAAALEQITPDPTTMGEPEASTHQQQWQRIDFNVKELWHHTAAAPAVVNSAAARGPPPGLTRK